MNTSGQYGAAAKGGKVKRQGKKSAKGKKMAKLAVFLFGVLMAASPAYAAGFMDCSGSVDATSAAVVFPKSGTTGNPLPTDYLQICNSHGSQTLSMNPVGGAAAATTAGSTTLAAGVCMTWNGAVPTRMNVIGSGSGTTYTCWYR